MVKRNKKLLMVAFGIALAFVMTISISYAFFYYAKDSENIPLISGSISIDFLEGTNNLSLQENYPKSDVLGMIEPYYYDFTVAGSKGKESILYEIQILEAGTNTLDPRYVKVYLTDQEDNVIVEPVLLSELKISEYNRNRVLYTGNIDTLNQRDLYRLRLWIDASYSENVESTFDFQINLYAQNVTADN